MQRHKILAFLLALVASVALWVYAVTFVNPDDTVEISDIRVRVTGTSSLTARGLMLTGGEEQYIDVEVSGRRSDLKELNSSNLEAIADLSNIDTAGTFELSWTLNPPATVASGDIRLVAANSDRVKVKISERRDRDIPVELVYSDGEMPEGYLQGATELSLSAIPVSGPSEEVLQIAKAVVHVDLTETTANFNEQLPFVFVDEDAQEVSLSEYTMVEAENVGVSIQVLPYRDLLLNVKYIDGGGLTANDVKATVTPSTVRVTGTLEALEKLGKSHDIVIDLATVQGLEPETLSRSVELPQGVMRLDESNSTVLAAEIAIEIDKNISILRIAYDKTELQWKNGEEGLEYFYADPDQLIEIRGKRNNLQQLQNKLSTGEKAIVAEIDITQMDQTQICPLQIRLPAGFGVGLFKEYTARIDSRTAQADTQP